MVEHLSPDRSTKDVCSARALCQGAGLHYVDVALGKRRPNGVKDFDAHHGAREDEMDLLRELTGSHTLAR